MKRSGLIPYFLAQRILKGGWKIGILVLPWTLAHGEGWWTQPPGQTKVVPSWNATETTGKPLRMEIQPSPGGGSMLVSNVRPVKLATAAKVPVNSEVTLYFTLHPEGKEVVRLSANIAEEGAPGVPVSVSYVAGADYLSVDAAGARAVYRPRGEYKRSLKWPEDLRKIVESEMASMPKLEEHTFSIRYVLHRDRCEVYFNDLLLSTRELIKKGPPVPEVAKGKKTKPLPDISLGGPLSITLGAHVNLVSAEIRPLGTPSPLFEPVRIDSRLNAVQLSGHTVEAASLPAPGEPAMVGDKPFVFPRHDTRGMDHIDVGESWLQNGTVEGDANANQDAFGGRWAGPWVENPTRLQFEVPKGRYRALHLIAASESRPDSVPLITVQFFRPLAGHPENFAARVPLFSAQSTEAAPLPVKFTNGSTANLWLVTIPIDPGAMAGFDDLDACAFEITKEVKLYRGYPDPLQYSAHAAGLPSAVQVYAMTLERPAVSLELVPDALGHLWTAPAKPSYTVKLHNTSGKAHAVKLELTTLSHDGSSKISQQVMIPVSAAGGTARFQLKLVKYGYHDVTLTMTDGDSVWTERRGLGWLQADTRAHGDWEQGRGSSYGFWDWAGGHTTPPRTEQIELMSKIGAEWVNHTLPESDPEGRAAAEKYHISSLIQGGASHYYTAAVHKYLDDPAKAREFLLEQFKKNEVKPSAVERPDNLSFFAEPQLGQITTGIPPDYYGGTYTFTKDEEERYQNDEKTFVFGARLAKEYWPNVKCQFPYGDPLFPVYFLRRSKEVRELMDGINVDIPVFDRLPENQIHQVSIHRCYIMREELRKAGIKNPNLVMVEGPSVPTRPGALSMSEQADNWVRLCLLLYGYGIDRQIGGWAVECANYWGEQHYGGGIFNPLPALSPKPSACALAAMTRHINRKNFTQWLPTGSLSVYALQYKHYQSGELTHAFWTLRGKRPVTVTVPAGAKVSLFDSMDNETGLPVTDGKVTFTVTTSPCYLEGVSADPTITLGEPDNGDARPAAEALPLANLGDGSWKMTDEEDTAYAGNSPLQIARFHGVMSAATVAAPAEQGGKAIAVHLGQQAMEQKIMPFYSVLRPTQPVVIPGKASHLGLWVKAASDWGRVVYCLRDAKGERWMSVGKFSEWNCDDPRSDSAFCFDGWRYLRFELPANSPYDRYREKGTSWWGYYGEGDGQVDLPLALEKIIVERRTSAMYVNDPQVTKADDVLLGGLFAEYANPADKTDETVRLDKVRMPVPTTAPDLGNPIRELAASGVGASPAVEKVTAPGQDADGTKCYVHFKPVDGAVSYDVWVSAYEDGRGALQLGKGWKEPGQLIVGLRPDTDFYVFVTVTGKDGKVGKPSGAFKIRLKNVFGMK